MVQSVLQQLVERIKVRARLQNTLHNEVTESDFYLHISVIFISHSANLSMLKTTVLTREQGF